MSNAVYQATVESLEDVLAPRVVSRALQEGLRQVGRTPEDVRLSDLEKILKAQVYRQLQVTMPVTEAKKAITDLIATLSAIPPEGPAGAGDEPDPLNTHERQVASLTELRSALKPYNLYFEWAEVQKLRAQLQLIEEEQEKRGDTGRLLAEARRQLLAVEQKLEDQLVLQARHLGELESILEQVRTLGGIKVRRLENLVGQIRHAQEARQLAPAEVERARKLGTDLRKLMESSVFAENAPDAEAPTAGAPAVEGERDPAGDQGLLEADTDPGDLLEIDTDALDPEVSARLLLLDVESERRDLDAVEADHGAVLEHRPALRERIAALRAELDAGASIGDAPADLRRDLEAETARLREELRAELETGRSRLGELHPDVDTAELGQALTVAAGILGTTLPSRADIEHVRTLLALAFERDAEIRAAEEARRAAEEARLDEQAEVLDRLQASLVRDDTDEDDEAYRALVREVDALREAHARGALDPERIAEAREAQQRLEAAVALRSDDASARQRAEARALAARVDALPAAPGIESRRESVAREIASLLERLEGGAVDAGEMAAATAMVDDLRHRATEAVRRRLSELTADAAELGDHDLLSLLQVAVGALDEGAWPDLPSLGEALGRARDARRQEQIAELRQLEGELAPYRASGAPAIVELEGILAEARARILEGEPARNLDRAWSMLEDVRAAAEAGLASFGPRLDAALASLARVEKLNSDDVAAVRRILRHLDSQRGAFDRISPGLRAQLAASLEEAEALLEQLGKEVEATQAIADQLMSGNVLDDVLGLFGSDADARPAPAGDERVPDEPEPEPFLESGNASVDAWLRGYLGERGVAAAALLVDGRLRAGILPVGDPVVAAFAQAEGDLIGLGGELELGGPVLATFETPGGTVIAAWPGGRRRLLLLVDVPAVLSLVLHRLRRDVERLRKRADGPAIA